MLYALSGDTEATAFGGSSSDVAVKENMVMLSKVESGGSITLNDGLWILEWEIDRSAREKAEREKGCVGLCCERRQRCACFDCRSCRPQEGANVGSLTLVSAMGAGSHCKGKRGLFITSQVKSPLFI